MLKEFLNYWGIDEAPFTLCPDPKMLYPSRKHKECLIRLKYAFYSNKGGAIVISDQPGDGKTSIVRHLLEVLRKETMGKMTSCFIDHPNLTPNQMIQEICQQLGVEKPSRSRQGNLNQLKKRLQELHEQKIKSLIVIDEAQMLIDYPSTLQELRILLNYSISDQFLLTVILVGQRQLEKMIKSYPEFWQRLPVRYFLENLNKQETVELIRYRLEKAGVYEDIFTEDGYNAIYQYSKGVPRVICSLADISMLIGFASNVRKMGLVEVHDACMDMDGSEQGFHYFKFIRASEQQSLQANIEVPGRKVSRSQASQFVEGLKQDAQAKQDKDQ